MTISSSTAPFFPVNHADKDARRGRCLLAAVVMAIGLLITPVLWADEAPSLDTLVWQYMDTPDAGQAEDLLEHLLQDPRASIPAISSILHTGRAYSKQAVGAQPSVSLSLRGRQYSYALAVPSTYAPTEDYGLVLCLHGAGFTGDAYLERWQARLGDRYILACPSYSMGMWWTRTAESLVLATLHDVMSRYRIDPNRVFLTGMSNGGIGAWLIGMHHADLFAGLAPMASGIDDVLFPFLANLKHTPVYVIHGAKDQVMPVRLSRQVVEELKKLDYEVIYREHDREHPMAGGHYFPREELSDLVTWLDQQRRVAAPTTVVVVRDATHLGPFAWTRIDATDRIAAFAENLIEGRDDFIRNRVYAKMLATRTGPNRIDVATALIQRYTVFLPAEWIDVSKPVVVTTNGQSSFDGLLTPSLETLLLQARQRHDALTLYPYHVTITPQSSR